MDLTPEEARQFVELAFDQMMDKAWRLGDEVAAVPELEGANSVYALIVHCVGVCDFWLDHVVLGTETTRDRAGEFVAVGRVEDLHELVGAFRLRLPDLLARVDRTAEPARPAMDFGRPWPWTVGAIVVHVIEEVFQHAGHIDITADLLLAGRTAEP